MCFFPLLEFLLNTIIKFNFPIACPLNTSIVFSLDVTFSSDEYFNHSSKIFASKVLFYILQIFQYQRLSIFIIFFIFWNIITSIAFFADRIKQYEELLKVDQNENWWNENMDIKQLCKFFNK